MAEDKKTMVKLVAGKASGEYDLEHAERILSMANNGGWTLPKDSPYKFTVKDGIKRKSSKGATSES